ncbi:phosphate ABC transporter substrate-binding protein [Persicirhabdus sediminis]|uniref:Phosphate-binding protein n=1 Tax=Persicirhabdus sediminis TaxID=454144 RepID=A0A8J7SML6_9BACT|nr:phosphate ABC transporter substrate-binding protein [Persicirhabdus sediminis]MBK1791178.1 phosphate ABC transporter substrate-binding protein [Persicirhabdus sediminis]
MKSTLLLGSVICLSALSSCSDSSSKQNENASAELKVFADQSGKLDIAGGTAHIPVMKAAAKEIMQFNPQIKITIAGGGSGVGAQQVAEGLVQIGNTGRPLKESEASRGLISHAFAVDGVAIILNPTNPVASLTQQQVIDIYSGKITNWEQLGGVENPISLYTRDEASGTRAVFFKKLLKQTPIAKSANVVPSNGAMKTSIANDPAAIGYSSIGFIDDSVSAPQLDGVTPSNEACLSGEYPITRKLFMNTQGEPSGITADFIQFIFSPSGAAFIEKSGYIAINAPE